MNKDTWKGLVAGAVGTAMLMAAGSALAAPVTQKINAVYRDIKVIIHGEQAAMPTVNGKKVEPFINNGTTYLPLRAVAEALHYDVTWDEQNNQISIKDKNRYEVAGIDDPKAFEAFYSEVQKLVAAGEKSKVADYVKYPLSVYKDGKATVYETKEQFIAGYDDIMTDKVKQALAGQKAEDTFVNYKGVMVGDGEIWFNVSPSGPHKFYIYSINH
ncbi:copper amine oxidase N-terminal domain-containing protein [Paenibacillus sp. GCM10023252]|uniref:copper amine oxidase N-terminal domain-containing protein n=1 Tax=Paenibacillus sp. GCM10023252 TaxID=3252649 RepID=UPI003613E656